MARIDVVAAVGARTLLDAQFASTKPIERQRAVDRDRSGGGAAATATAATTRRTVTPLLIVIGAEVHDASVAALRRCSIGRVFQADDHVVRRAIRRVGVGELGVIGPGARRGIVGDGGRRKEHIGDARCIHLGRHVDGAAGSGQRNARIVGRGQERRHQVQRGLRLLLGAAQPCIHLRRGTSFARGVSLLPEPQVAVRQFADRRVGAAVVGVVAVAQGRPVARGIIAQRKQPAGIKDIGDGRCAGHHAMDLGSGDRVPTDPVASRGTGADRTVIVQVERGGNSKVLRKERGIRMARAADDGRQEKRVPIALRGLDILCAACARHAGKQRPDEQQGYDQTNRRSLGFRFHRVLHSHTDKLLVADKFPYSMRCIRVDSTGKRRFSRLKSAHFQLTDSDASGRTPAHSCEDACSATKKRAEVSLRSLGLECSCRGRCQVTAMCTGTKNVHAGRWAPGLHPTQNRRV